jgi:hypothetical protein
MELDEITTLSDNGQFNLVHCKTRCSKLGISDPFMKRGSDPKYLRKHSAKLTICDIYLLDSDTRIYAPKTRYT